MFRGVKITVAGLFLCALIGVFLGVGVDTFYYANGTAYMSNDPAGCVNCHIMREQFDSWQHGMHHANAVCNDCHVPDDFFGKWYAKAAHGYRHSKAFTLQDFHEPIQITPADRIIVRDNCVRCHEAMVSELPGTVGHGGGGFGIGAAVEDALDCLHCHAAAGHGHRR